VKPSVEYLDSLNAYRKRTRSPEMDLFDEPESKAPRLASAPPTEPALLGEGEDEMEGVPLASGDDPIVYGRPHLRACECTLMTSPVNGEPMPFSAVTDEHHERMTADEYTAYFDVFQARGG
jgi:transcription initiation factor TFIIE subunit alpha